LGEAPQPSRVLTLAITFALALGYVMAMLDATAVNVARDKIRGEFGAPLPAVGGRRGTVNLINNGRNEAHGMGWTCRQRCYPGNAGDLSPRLKRLGPGHAILISWKVIAAEIEEVVDPVVGGKETLRLAG
jgi:hypothetical protein